MNDTVEEIIERQRSFFKEGTTRTLSFRVKQLKLLKKQLMSYELELLEALSKDLGKSSMEGFMTEIGLVYRHLDQMITKLPKWGSKKKVRTPLFLWPSTSFIEPTPYGNCLIISPFNYPVLLTLDPLIGAIAGGNTALVGMSEYTPYTNIILSTIIRDTFLPDYVHCYTSNKETNQLVLEYQFDKLFFTGSESVGKIVLEKAAKHLTPTTLELGGKSPVIVTAYADIELAAQRIIWGKFINAGQTCVAPDYCLVDAKIKGELLEEMGRTITQFFGDSPKDSPDYARLINKEACHRIQGLIERDRSLIYMGGDVDESSLYVSPTLLYGEISADLASMEQEIFGPILPVLSYEHVDDAISFVKNRPKPLAFYPFSSEKSDVEYLVDSIDAGGVTVNDTLLHLSNEHLPFGGVGASGMGHYHGKATLDCFTYPKAILKRSTLIHLKAMFPPYTKEKEGLIQSFFK